MSFSKTVFLFLSCLALCISGCSPFGQVPLETLQAEDTVSLEVPFIPQARSHDCGPAALAAVLEYHGREVSLQEITKMVYIPEIRRTLLPDMENFARELGFKTGSGRGSLELLRRNVDSQRPVIVLMDAGSGIVDRPHYIVILGYTCQGFLAHTGVKENAFIDAHELDRRWEKMNRIYLVIK